jgi:type II secretory pathway component PulC
MTARSAFVARAAQLWAIVLFHTERRVYLLTDPMDERGRDSLRRIKAGYELRLSDRHIVALNVLLLTVLAYFAVVAGKDLLALRSSVVDAPLLSRRGRIANSSPANQSRAAYQAIVDRDIFNLVPPLAPPPQVVAGDLHITLVGVSQASKGKPFAIVADEQGEQSVYRVGEIIHDSGKLLEVDKDRAIVEHGGKQVVLELPKDDMGDSSQGFASDSSSSNYRSPRANRPHHSVRR